MTSEEAKRRIEELTPRLLQELGRDVDGSRDKQISCVEPENHRNGDKTPSAHYYAETNTVHCFGCGASHNAYTLIRKVFNIPEADKQATFLKGCELAGIDPQDITDDYTKKWADTEPNYISFYNEAAKNLSKTDYLSSRGISQETAEFFNLGYIENWKHPKAPTAPASPRLIIPTGKRSYLARDTRPNPPKTKDGKDYSKSKVGTPKLFNAEALRSAAEPIFITEGELDAISIYEAGGQAVALGSANYKNKLYEALEKYPTKQPLILTLDNDVYGERASAEIFLYLKEKGFNICELNVQKPYKDANEALMKNRSRLIEKVKEAKEIAESSADIAQQLQYEYTNQALSYIDTMRRELEKERELPTISTGFKNIDSIINGGLYPGLYFIGAISSLGKTTLALQIADNIAKQGQDTLIISLEMAKRELIAKSVSRETAEYSLQVDGKIKALGQTTADIMTLKRQQGYYDKAGSWQEFTEQRKQAINAAVDIAFRRYSEYAKHIFIYEGIGDITPESIKARVEKHRAIYGTAPVVIVDYLQIMAGDSERLSDKQRVDKGVVELKRISRDFKIPVIAISSVNRASYEEPITMESFKESGGIEFSSDILIGLQYKGMDYKTEENGKRENEAKRLQRLAELGKEMREAARAGDPQPIQVKILKNRNGSRGTAELSFYPMFNYFKEREAEPEEKPRELRRG